MGKSETSTLSLGIRIKLKSVLDHINGDNYNEIKILLEKGIIDDKNGFYNSVYGSIINGCDPLTNKYIDLDKMKCKEYKKYLMNALLKYGDEYHTKYGGYKLRTYENDDSENLYHGIIMLPFIEILKTERWGYDIHGVNGTSCEYYSLNDNVSTIHEKMKELNINKSDYTVIYIISQDTD